MKSIRDALGKQAVSCVTCNTEFKCDPSYINDPKCPSCLSKERKKVSPTQMKQVIRQTKQSAEDYKGTFEFNFETPEAKLTACPSPTIPANPCSNSSIISKLSLPTHLCISAKSVDERWSCP